MSRLLKFSFISSTGGGSISRNLATTSYYIKRESSTTQTQRCLLRYTLSSSPEYRFGCRQLHVSSFDEKPKDKFKYNFKNKDEQKDRDRVDAKKVLSSKTYQTLKSFDTESSSVGGAGGSQEIPGNALKKVFLTEFCIFFVFGFFDNFIMMSVGESIDLHMGKLIPHAMLAAAFGNWISDLFGLISGERVEDWMNKHYPSPPLTHEQLLSKRLHNFKHLGRFIGISIGCLIGAIVAYPLLDIDLPDEEFKEKFGHEKTKLNEHDKEDLKRKS